MGKGRGEEMIWTGKMVRHTVHCWSSGLASQSTARVWVWYYGLKAFMISRMLA